MRILAVNIRAGGTRTRILELIDRCVAHDCDVLVFAEFRNNAQGEAIQRALRLNGYVYQASSGVGRENGVLIVSRTEFLPVSNPFGFDRHEYPDAVLQATFENGLRLYGVYLPGQDRKRPHLRCLIAAAQYCNEKGIDALCIGDFNSGRNATDIEINLGRNQLRDEFSTADLYAELERYWTETWLYFYPNQSDFSWYPFRLDPQVRRRNGWRIDKAFASKSLLPKITSTEYDHGFRENLLTDHSAILVGFGLSR